ncbi:hypothetical protein NPIL_97021 [Nephila pilipes]|uniref:Uncharacterized protein n=1 Tax=Nephila pilipes TaxID=299642 RepID=A0A8X6U9B1_NEPPI|nr:hypothetical protein NPIL_97021 [Nephila pilipes]
MHFLKKCIQYHFSDCSITSSQITNSSVEDYYNTRLELMASAIDDRLFSSVKQALKRPNISIYFWTDSFTVLTWITRREQWSVFVTNRISEIKKLTILEDSFRVSTD